MLAFAAAAVLLGIWGDMPMLFWLTKGTWSLAFGGAATLFQTAAASTSGAGFGCGTVDYLDIL